ncbi:MAG: zf-HC2 domain-containing protein, partial [Chloroflexota bacterium]|nr:zf-HC2 domain-containing protein [Chloroflexota bacterium]
MGVQGAHLSFERLSAFVDREVEPAEQRGVRAHLDACAACSAEVARLESVARILEALPAADCAAALELISAHADRETAPPSAALTERHLRDCDACRAEMDAWSALDVSLRALPAAFPSPRTDAAIAAIVRRGVRRSRLARTAPLGLRAALAVVTAIAITLIGPFERDVDLQDGGQSRVSVETPLFAEVQYAVLNPRTNTLYLAQPALGRVAALDATTRAQVASIAVGGRPTALALDEAANAILVMDASLKTVTEIDGARNTVGTTTTLAIDGTPTAIHVDGANRKIVVTGAASAPSAAPPPIAGRPTAPPSAKGFVAVIDGGTKRLETQRPVDAAPRAVVLNAAGTRALLVSADATMLVDAATYRAVDR